MRLSADDEGDPADRSRTCPDQAHNSGALKLAANSPEDNQRDRRCRSARLKRTEPEGQFQYSRRVSARLSRVLRIAGCVAVQATGPGGKSSQAAYLCIVVTLGERAVMPQTGTSGPDH